MISRARDRAELVTDDGSKLLARLTRQATLRTDLSLMMGAVGLWGVLVEAPETGGI